ncbi:MAG: hypothetical protein IJB95_00265, partial [Clostridia bacterium]|nr:hypothetical protein [Clostridia bacterium]
RQKFCVDSDVLLGHRPSRYAPSQQRRSYLPFARQIADANQTSLVRKTAFSSSVWFLTAKVLRR